MLAIGACGGGGSFSASGFDVIEVGDSADSVKDELGDPTAVQELADDGSVWIYCDGARPYYLVVGGDRVTEDDVQLPDELRVEEASCS